MKDQTKDSVYAGETEGPVNKNQPDAAMQKGKPKNQNQEHNVKKEGTGRLNQMR